MELACPSCGAEHVAGARFCSVCGDSLVRECPACGAEQAASSSFCSRCGLALVAGARRGEASLEREERRVVTVLFADLSGSTALGEALDPEDVRVVQGELFDLVNAEVERFGGVSEKFVGDAILAVFGIPQTHEDDADRAVRAALAVRDAFPTFAASVAERHGAEVGVRIGVNTGEVVSGRDAAARGEMMVSGDAVNVAARLQQLADPGLVLVGERTHSATRRTIAYRKIDSVEAKGKSQRLEAWCAVDVLAASGARATGFAAPLIGRDDELALLRLTAARVQRERAPQLVTVFGHAGVGKSRLLAEFVGGLEGARVLVGRCVPYGDGITYLPLAELASSLAEILDDDPNDIALAKLNSSVRDTVSSEHVEQVLAAVAWTMGLSLPDSAAGLSGGADVRRSLHEAWARYVGALARESLVALVIEDIHWASEPLLDLLDHLLVAVEGSAVLLVCLSRPELVDTRPSWGAGRLNASSLTLAPLGSSESETLLRALLDTDVPDQVARRILEPAEGNPFFLEEMLSMLVEQGALEQRNGGWRGTERLNSVRVPDSINAIIAARIDLLESGERDALRRCSVMGRAFWPSAVGVDDDVIAGLGRRALVSEQPSSAFSGRREFSFKHALTHEVAYETLPRAERRELHRRVAEWIRESIPDREGETTELVAYHYEQALAYGEPDDDLRRNAFTALLAAGDAVMRRGAYTSAERLLGRSLELAPDEHERARALLLAGRGDVHGGNYARAVERLDEAIAVADRNGNVAINSDALGWKARASWLRGDWREALRSSQEATLVLEGLPESAELARALARLSQIEMLRSLPTAASTAERAIGVARRTGEMTAEANARTNLFTALSMEGVVPSPAEMEAVVALAFEAGAPDEAVRAVVNFLWSAALLGPLDPAERTVRDAIGSIGAGLAAENYASYLALSFASLIFVPAGRWAEADEVVAKEEEPVGIATNRLVWLWLRAGLAFRRGDLELTDRHLPELREVALASEEPQRIIPMACVAMPRAVLAGDRDSLRTLAEAVLGLSTAAITNSPSATSISRSLAAAGESDLLSRYARQLDDGTERASTTVVSDVARGLSLRLDGQAAEAAHLLAATETSVRELGRRYEAACLAIEVADALDIVGDRSGAEAARARAAAVLDPLGCVNPY